MKYKTKVRIFGIWCFLTSIYFVIQLLDFDFVMYPMLLATIAVFWISGWGSIYEMDRINNDKPFS